MPLQDLLEALAREAEDERARLRRSGEKEQERILAEARAEADALRRSVLDAAETRARADATRRVAVARLEAARIEQQAAEAAFDELVEEVRSRLRAIGSRPDYPQVLSALLAEALEAVPDAEVVLVNPADVATIAAAAVVGNTMAGVTVAGDEGVEGGVVATSSKGRRVRNTMSGRLESADADLRQWYRSRLGPAAARSVRSAP
ncbi:V/A-type H+-transporting ATPase subunit E [Microbacterium sp. AK009]|uniref:V-type ATP synthase subunit E n=1 Tax=Microbacterium sp. AK009 TaxID=2723068 RepID=UPI0015C77A04|nr:V-type ATP synthase subunit E [Microbacterium sp. AK009]NYF16575.1 V/A-type H+-transporting ATPase subunit E [Microbacterium sp. AK009]